MIKAVLESVKHVLANFTRIIEITVFVEKLHAS